MLFAMGCLAWTCSANAGTIYRGGFDPTSYGGIVEIEVPTACVLTTGWIATGGVGDCGVVDILSAFVQNPPPPAIATDTLNFAPPTVTNAISGLLWASNTLIGIDSSEPLFAGPSGGSFFNNTDGYELIFHSGHFADSTGGPEADLVSCTRGDGDGDDDDIESPKICTTLVGDTAAAFHDGFVQVPEPASPLLVIAALAAGWLARRRVHPA